MPVRKPGNTWFAQQSAHRPCERTAACTSRNTSARSALPPQPARPAVPALADHAAENAFRLAAGADHHTRPVIRRNIKHELNARKTCGIGSRGVFTYQSQSDCLRCAQILVFFMRSPDGRSRQQRPRHPTPAACLTRPHPQGLPPSHEELRHRPMVRVSPPAHSAPLSPLLGSDNAR